MLTDEQLSLGLNIVGENIPTIWEGLTSAGFTFPAAARDFVRLFAKSGGEAELLDRYWIELARVLLARAPFYTQIHSADWDDTPPQAYKSAFLKGTWERMRNSDVVQDRKLNYSIPVEPALIRFWQGYRNPPGAGTKEFRSLHDTSVPADFLDASSWDWLAVSPSSAQYAAITDQLTIAMAKCGFQSKPARRYARLPVFRLDRIGDSLELILYIHAQGRQVAMGLLDVNFAVIPLDGKFNPENMPVPYRARFVPETLVPFFASLRFFRSRAQLIWTCSAIATLSSLLRDRMRAAFDSL